MAACRLQFLRTVGALASSRWPEAALSSWPRGQYLRHGSLFHQTAHVCKARRQEQASPGKTEVTILCNLVTEVIIAVEVILLWNLSHQTQPIPQGVTQGLPEPFGHTRVANFHFAKEEHLENQLHLWSTSCHKRNGPFYS